MKHWLVKSEPEVYSIDDLAAEPDRTTFWDGVRNYQARNFMRDDMKRGDRVFFYHSNCSTPGIAGMAKVASDATPDPTALDPEHLHHDPKSSINAPRWYGVDLRFERKFAHVISLVDLKLHAESELLGFNLLQRGTRLSVMPVTEEQWNFILTLE